MADLGKVVIVGGGIIGCSTAFHLAELGVKCTVVERTAIACAASGKAGGFLARTWCDESPVGPLARASFDLLKKYGAQFDCDYRPMDSLQLSYTEGDQSGRRHTKATQQPDWLDGTGIGYSEVIGNTSNTAQVHPWKLTNAFMNAATSRAGSRVKIGTMVKLNFKESDDPCEKPGKKVIQSLSLESGEEIPCDTLILAMGPWTSQAAEWLNYRIPIVTGQRAHSIVIAPKSSAGQITPHALFVNYSQKDGEILHPEVYPRPDGTVYMCVGLPDDNTALPSDPSDVSPCPSSITTLHHMLKSLSSELSDAEMVLEQACFLPMPSQNAPIIGKLPDFSGIYIATGHHCWGILNSAATGKALAEVIVNGKSDIDLSPFNPSLHL